MDIFNEIFKGKTTKRVLLLLEYMRRSGVYRAYEKELIIYYLNLT